MVVSIADKLIGTLRNRKFSQDNRFGTARVMLTTARITVLFLLLQVSSSLGESISTQQQTSSRAISLLLLIDASGSMRSNDPDSLRIAALQLVISQLSPRDHVAVVEFDSEARLLSGTRESPWISASQLSLLNQVLGSTSDRGDFTDFRAGVEAIADLFAKAPATEQNAVLLLSDGILEPNLLSETYRPHSENYAFELNKNVMPLSQLKEKYYSLTRPMAKRIIFDEAVPSLRKDKIEVFTVSLSSKADSELLQRIADETSLRQSEQHYFHAEKATDLVSVFSGLIGYWSDVIVVQSDSGSIRSNDFTRLYLDGYLSEPTVACMVDGQGAFVVRTDSGELESALPGTHSKLKKIRILRQEVPGTWQWGFESGSGKYRTIWLGHNLLEIRVDGIQSRYLYGDTVRAVIGLVSLSERVDVRRLAESQLFAEVTLGGRTASIDIPMQRESSSRTEFSFVPPDPGKFLIRFVLKSLDSLGRSSFVRESRQFRFDVMPGFFVEPKRIYFGKAADENQVTMPVTIHSALPAMTKVGVSGRVRNSSAGDPASLDSGRIPRIDQHDVYLTETNVLGDSVSLLIPSRCYAGDYEGSVTFATIQGDSATIEFSVHVPSLWERFRWWILGIVLLAAIAVLHIIRIGAFAPLPRGTLTSVSSLDSVIRLSELRRGFWTRWFNWRRNYVRIGGRSAHIRLQNHIAGSAEMKFVRRGRVFLRNTSLGGAMATVLVTEPTNPNPYVLEADDRLGLKEKCIIDFFGRKYRFSMN